MAWPFSNLPTVHRVTVTSPAADGSAADRIGRTYFGN